MDIRSARPAYEAGKEADELCILYLRIVEQGVGFGWRVHLHGIFDPLSVCEDLYRTDREARAAGLIALKKACGQFDRFALLARHKSLASHPRDALLERRVNPLAAAPRLRKA